MYLIYEIIFIGLSLIELIQSLSINHNLFTSLQIKQSKINSFRPLNVALTQAGLDESEQSITPIVSWYLLEKNIPFTSKPLQPLNRSLVGNTRHFLDNIYFLTYDEVVKSYYELLSLAVKYDHDSMSTKGPLYTSRIKWAERELSDLCREKLNLDRSNKPDFDILEKILLSKDYIISNEFSIADVAIASYLNYVPIVYPNADVSFRPNIVRYMQRNAQRECYIKAFGKQHSQLIFDKTEKWLKKSKFSTK